jgi:deoxyhypusine synthase
VTWGKVDKDTYLRTTESMNCDYSIVMPFLVKALLDKHLRRSAGYRLFEKRAALVNRLLDDVRANQEWLFETLEYPLAALAGQR